MEFLLNLLLVRKKILSTTVGEVVNNTVRRCLQFKRKILAEYKTTTQMIGPFENMSEFINYNSSLYKFENEKYIVTNEVHYNICQPKYEEENTNHKDNQSSSHQLFELYKSQTFQKKNLNTTKQELKKSYLSPPEENQKQSKKEISNHNRIIDNLHAILKSQEFLLKNVIKLITILEKENVISPYSTKLEKIKKKLTCCTDILSNNTNFKKDSIIDHIIDEEITRCRFRTGENKTSAEISLKTPKLGGLAAAIDATQKEKKTHIVQKKQEEKDTIKKQLSQQNEMVTQQPQLQKVFKGKYGAIQNKTETESNDSRIILKRSEPAISVSFKPEDYGKILTHIRREWVDAKRLLQINEEHFQKFENCLWHTLTTIKFLSLKDEHLNMCRCAFQNRRQFRVLEIRIFKRMAQEKEAEELRKLIEINSAVFSTLEQKLLFEQIKQEIKDSIMNTPIEKLILLKEIKDVSLQTRNNPFLKLNDAFNKQEDNLKNVPTNIDEEKIVETSSKISKLSEESKLKDCFDDTRPQSSKSNLTFDENKEQDRKMIKQTPFQMLNTSETVTVNNIKQEENTTLQNEKLKTKDKNNQSIDYASNAKKINSHYQESAKSLEKSVNKISSHSEKQNETSFNFINENLEKNKVNSTNKADNKKDKNKKKEKLFAKTQNFSKISNSSPLETKYDKDNNEKVNKEKPLISFRKTTSYTVIKETVKENQDLSKKTKNSFSDRKENVWSSIIKNNNKTVSSSKLSSYPNKINQEKHEKCALAKILAQNIGRNLRNDKRYNADFPVKVRYNSPHNKISYPPNLIGGHTTNKETSNKKIEPTQINNKIKKTDALQESSAKKSNDRIKKSLSQADLKKEADVIRSNNKAFKEFEATLKNVHIIDKNNTSKTSLKTTITKKPKQNCDELNKKKMSTINQFPSSILKKNQLTSILPKDKCKNFIQKNNFLLVSNKSETFLKKNCNENSHPPNSKIRKNNSSQSQNSEIKKDKSNSQMRRTTKNAMKRQQVQTIFPKVNKVDEKVKPKISLVETEEMKATKKKQKKAKESVSTGSKNQSNLNTVAKPDTPTNILHCPKYNVINNVLKEKNHCVRWEEEKEGNITQLLNK